MRIVAKTGEIESAYCPRSVGFLYDNVNHTIVPAPCKSYSCPHCGVKKMLKLRERVRLFLRSLSHVRMWTFTSTSRELTLPEQHKLMQLAWHNFTKELRRCPALRPAARATQYIRVIEFHKSKAVHFHVVVSEFLPVEIVRNLWRAAYVTAAKDASKFNRANVNVLHAMSAESIADYIAKYVSKASAFASDSRLHTSFNRYSKSSGVPPFFPMRQTVAQHTYTTTYEFALELTLMASKSASAHELPKAPTLSDYYAVLDLSLNSDSVLFADDLTNYPEFNVYTRDGLV